MGGPRRHHDLRKAMFDLGTVLRPLAIGYPVDVETIDHGVSTALFPIVHTVVRLYTPGTGVAAPRTARAAENENQNGKANS